MCVVVDPFGCVCARGDACGGFSLSRAQTYRHADLMPNLLGKLRKERQLAKQVFGQRVEFLGEKLHSAQKNAHMPKLFQT